MTAGSPSESTEVSVIAGQLIGPKSWQEEFRQAERIEGEELDNLSNFFDRSLLAELITGDTWMVRFYRVIERIDRQSFELMGPSTNPFWHQMSVVDDCILVDNSLPDQDSFVRRSSNDFIVVTKSKKQCWTFQSTCAGHTCIWKLSI